MYPLPVILIGHPGEIKRSVQRELTSLGAQIERECDDVPQCLGANNICDAEIRLFVVEVTSEEDVHRLARLNDRFVGFPVLAVVQVQFDPGLLVAAMRAGAAQVVRAPIESRDFQEAMTRIATQFGHAPARCEVIAVASASEGAGATSVSINLAAEIARSTDQNCLLVEATTAYGRMAHRLNVTPPVTTYELVTQSDRLDVEFVRKAMTRIDDRLHAIVGPYQEMHGHHPQIQSIVKTHTLTQQVCDVLVVDMASGLDDTYFDFLQTVDQIVLVAEQRLVGVSGLKAFLDKLGGPKFSARVLPVLNKYDPGLPEFSTKAISRLLELEKVYSIRRDDQLFRESENQGRTLHQMTLHARVLEDFEDLAAAVLHQEQTQRKRGIFSRLAHALHR